jgi:hypothetical protein
MGLPRIRFALPVLSRELFEMSARRRTFIQRSVFAGAFLGIVFWSQSRRMGYSGNGLFDVLGSGRRMFEELVWWQFAAVILVMPLITCGAIVQEKQRDTLALLLTTRTTPVGIIVQKLISRVCLMLTLLLVALPLVAFAYSLGGVQIDWMVGSFVALVVLTVVIGSLSIMWSVICSSAVGAFVATVLSGIVMALPASCLMAGIVSGPASGISRSLVVLLPLLGALPSAACVGIAAGRLRESALQPPKNHLVILFRAIDAFFENINHVTGGVRLIQPRDTLPSDDPITWRETEKKALGQVHHLLRVIIVLELPVILVLVVALTDNSRGRGARLEPLVVMLWMISVGLIIIRTSGLISTERTRQTLDVLLTTPMSGPSILRQYQAGTRRLMYALSVPFATIIVSSACVRHLSVETVYYIVGSTLTIAIYMPLCAWLSMWIGLKTRNQISGLMINLVIVLVWIFGPLLISPGHPGITDSASFLTPASVVMVLESHVRNGDLIAWLSHQVKWTIQSLAIYAAILWAIRWRCLSVADARLGRCEPTHASETH